MGNATLFFLIQYLDIKLDISHKLEYFTITEMTIIKL